MSCDFCDFYDLSKSKLRLKVRLICRSFDFYVVASTLICHFFLYVAVQGFRKFSRLLHALTFAKMFPNINQLQSIIKWILLDLLIHQRRFTWLNILVLYRTSGGTDWILIKNSCLCLILNDHLFYRAIRSFYVSFLALLDYVSRAHGIANCPSSVVRPSVVRPSSVRPCRNYLWT